MESLYTKVLSIIGSPVSQRAGIAAMKIAIAIIFLWIGALKFVPYEAESITPFVANSPLMSFFYEHPDDYRPHLIPEGEINPEKHTWQMENHTYRFARGLGTVELTIGFLVVAGLWSRRVALVGVALAFATPFVTLSFLITTPEAWVPAHGAAQHGFPYLSGAGRLVVKDVALLAGAWLVLVSTAGGLMARRSRDGKAD